MVQKNHDAFDIDISDVAETEHEEIRASTDCSLVSHAFLDKDHVSCVTDVGNFCLSHNDKLFGFDLLPKPEFVDHSDVKVSLAGESCSIEKSRVHVDHLNVGSVSFGKLWCNKHAIFPKGFKSRVKYFNVLNPMTMSCYISEVHDAGLLGPLFKVTLEENPSESFTDVSADWCWEMVLQKLNQEITRRLSLGEHGLPPVQPPHSINGLEMFGFFSPSIVQDIEALDPNRKCVEYWKTKLTLKGDCLVKPESICSEGNPKPVTSEKALPIEDHNKSSVHSDDQSVFRGLLKKANPEELEIMHRILCSEIGGPEWRVALATLTQEIQRTCR